MRIRRLPQAIRDLDEIVEWIAADNLAAAKNLAERIARATDRLIDFPESGSPHPEIGPGVRGIVVRHYLILYRVAPDSVDIVRVVHGARELGGLLGGDREG